jgi:sodium/potassium-transporting ATPase subunit alpha
MHVTECSIGLKIITPESARAELVSASGKAGKSGNAIQQLRAIAGLCNSGEFDEASANVPLHERNIFGDATDQAMLRFSEGLGPVSDLRLSWKKTSEIAFNSKNKFMIRTFSLIKLEGLKVAVSPAEEVSHGLEDVLVPFPLFASIARPLVTVLRLLTIKGAPDILIGRCTHFIDGAGNKVILDQDSRPKIEAIKNQWSSQGKRVILLARKIIPGQLVRSSPSSGHFDSELKEQAGMNLTLVGLVIIADPLRNEIPEVVRILRGAGIRMFMVSSVPWFVLRKTPRLNLALQVTGDFALTAHAVAAECGIISNIPSMVHTITALSRDDKCIMSAEKATSLSPPNDRTSLSSIIISGPELMTLNDNQWDHLCQYHEIVFARTTPEHKLRIVKELQARGEIVGMTGDGVNDAPSLKAADIGIALGSGSDIAIEAADMVLLDSFSAIVEAVQYGRVVFDNLKKTIAYLLPAGSFSEFWPVFTNILFGLPQILSSFLMIVIW